MKFYAIKSQRGDYLRCNDGTQIAVTTDGDPLWVSSHRGHLDKFVEELPPNDSVEYEVVEYTESLPYMRISALLASPSTLADTMSNCGRWRSA